MATARVYQYDYFDRLLKRDRRSVDFATSDAIMEMGGTIIAESMREIDEDLLDDNGVIKAKDLPPRPIAQEEEVRPQWMRPDDTRVGPR